MAAGETLPPRSAVVVCSERQFRQERVTVRLLTAQAPDLPAETDSPALFTVRFVSDICKSCRPWSLPSTGMDDYAAKVWRTPVPPTPCVVDSSKVFPDLAQSARWRNQTPLWLRSHGLVIGPELPGVVLRWARLATGGWIAEVRVEASTGHGGVPLTLWCDQSAVRAA